MIIHHREKNVLCCNWPCLATREPWEDPSELPQPFAALVTSPFVSTGADEKEEGEGQRMLDRARLLILLRLLLWTREV